MLPPIPVESAAVVPNRDCELLGLFATGTGMLAVHDYGRNFAVSATALIPWYFVS